MKIKTTPIMNSLTQFFVFVFKAIFHRNKHIPKKQLKHFFYTGVRRFSISGGGEGGGGGGRGGEANLSIDRFIEGREGRHNAFQNYWERCLAPAAPPPPVRKLFVNGTGLFVL